MSNGNMSLHRNILLLRRILPATLFIAVVVYETFEHNVFGHFSSLADISLYLFLDSFIYGLVGPAVFWWALSWIAGRVAKQEKAQLELSRMHRSLQEANQQLVDLNRITRTVASGTSVQEMVDSTLRMLGEMLGVEAISLTLFDEEKGAWSSHSWGNDADTYEEAMTSLVRERIQEWGKGERHSRSKIPPFRSDAVLGNGKLSLVAVPLVSGDNVIGAVCVARHSSAPLADQRLNLLITVADELAVAIESARLRTRHLRALYEVDQTIRAEFDLPQLLNQILEKMIRACRADCGSVLLYNAETRGWELKSASHKTGSSCSACHNLHCLLGLDTPNPVTPMLIVDLQQHQGWPAECDRDGVRSVLAAPLSIEESFLGMIVLGHHRPNAFSGTELELLSAVANYAALIIRNTQLHTWAAELAITGERNRIAREIHDGLAQNLAFLMLKIDLCLTLLGDEQRVRSELLGVKESLRENIRGVRRSIFALRPVELEKLGFLPALRKFAEEFGEQNGVNVQLLVSGEENSLASKLEPTIFRLIQEALNNVGKHAKAANVWIDLSLSSQSEVALAVRDDGRGFDLDATLSDAVAYGHLGLTQMREKVESMGGTIAVETNPGRGTRVEVSLPTLKR